ncbi:MAG: 1-(5-phosphoribosyl)-5-[(5-phosphoribosylamino)methylideneamino]imidazole-4-carboxamide isomerase [Candidatus Omnitrophota bacterium]
MIIIPAIDIMNGRVVRLRQGDFTKVKKYPNNPLEYAKKWQRQGAELLHIVDLDGARTGEPKNFSVIKDIIDTVNIPVEVGGGIRSGRLIADFLDIGASYVIVGTKALIEKHFLKEIVEKYKNKIVVSVDSRDGFVRTEGWRKKTNIKSLALIKDLEKAGVARVIFTDISKDGMLKGINIELIKDIFLHTDKIKVIISGGISGYSDIVALRALDNSRLIGVISGKALYERKISLMKAQKVCLQKE